MSSAALLRVSAQIWPPWPFSPLRDPGSAMSRRCGTAAVRRVLTPPLPRPLVVTASSVQRLEADDTPNWHNSRAQAPILGWRGEDGDCVKPRRSPLSRHSSSLSLFSSRNQHVSDQAASSAVSLNKASSCFIEQTWSWPGW